MTDADGSIPDGFSWAYEDLHGHVRTHLAMIGPYAATIGRPPARDVAARGFGSAASAAGRDPAGA